MAPRIPLFETTAAKKTEITVITVEIAKTAVSGLMLLMIVINAKDPKDAPMTSVPYTMLLLRLKKL